VLSANTLPQPGAIIAGKYRAERVLARGGMGVILEAEHLELGQRVAIKFLLPDAVRQAEMVERFLREARAAAQLQSDHVVRVFDIGKTEAGIPYMVMELLPGNDLADELRARGQLPVAEAVGYVLDALDAIVEAHAAGIVHRDLKPSNLFLVRKPDGTRRAKVLDFGISKFSATAAPDAALTTTKSMLGSPGYMSPEQVRSTKSVDARTDVWALGVILYEALTGKPAFEGESLGDIFAKIREEDLPAAQEARPDLPVGLDGVLRGCLQRDRDKRTADAATLRMSLAPYARQRDLGAAEAVAVRAVTRVDAATLASVDTTQALAAPEPSPNQTLATWTGGERRKRRGALVASGALGIVALATVGAWTLRSGLDGAGATPNPTPATPTLPAVVATQATRATNGVGAPAPTPSAALVLATAAPDTPAASNAGLGEGRPEVMPGNAASATPNAGSAGSAASPRPPKAAAPRAAPPTAPLPPPSRPKPPNGKEDLGI
jgi:serine/threonine-protein kinase